MGSYKEWLNKPCPKCGQNVLTDEDYKHAVIVRKALDITNSMSEEELKQIADLVGDNLEELKKHPMFKETLGLENLLNKEALSSMTISTHKEIKIEEIKLIPTKENLQFALNLLKSMQPKNEGFEIFKKETEPLDNTFQSNDIAEAITFGMKRQQWLEYLVYQRQINELQMKIDELTDHENKRKENNQLESQIKNIKNHDGRII